VSACMRVWIALILSFLPAWVYGLEFGEITLYSYCEEPFDAEIELLGSESLRPEDITIRLAFAEEFRKADIPYRAFLSNFRFNISRITTNTLTPRTFIKISTQDPIQQPLIEFLIDVRWNAGHLVRGYTLSLDPIPSHPLSLKERHAAFLEKERRFSEEKLALEMIRAITHTNILSRFIGSMSYGGAIEMRRLSMEVLLQACVESQQSISLTSRMHPPTQTISASAERLRDSIKKSKTSTPSVQSISGQAFLKSISQSNKAVTAGVWMLMGFLLFFTLKWRKKINRVRRVTSPAGVTTHPSHAPQSQATFTQTALSVTEQSMRPIESNESKVFQHEMALKLELAEYYRDVGDVENALDLLREVLQRGNKQDQALAERLIFSIENTDLHASSHALQ